MKSKSVAKINAIITFPICTRNLFSAVLSYSKNAIGVEKASKKGDFVHIGNEIQICSQNKCHHHLSNVCD